MAPITQLTLYALHFWRIMFNCNELPEDHDIRGVKKSVAIVGAGSAGLAALKTILDLPEETIANWDIVLYEKRWDVGGVWLPDSQIPQPPDLPDTPLYPLLHTIAPHPTMTFPHTGIPFPPMTPLLPSHEYVEQYHRVFSSHFHLKPYIKFNHDVLSASWAGNFQGGHWAVEVKNHEAGSTENRAFNHLIVAGGRNHYPATPNFPGLNEWLAEPPTMRKAIHSIYFRDLEDYRGKNVLVVGGGASGEDIAGHIASVAQVTYLSTKPKDLVNVTVPGTIRKPQLSYLDRHSIHFADGSSITDVDTIILAIGYEIRFPFLTQGNQLAVVPIPHSPAEHDDEHLSTNLRYIRPLHEHILSLSSEYPLGSLYFVGLPTYTHSAPCDMAQSLFVAQTIANPSLLNPNRKASTSSRKQRQALLDRLREQEASLRAQGVNPDVDGHQFIGRVGIEHDYQDDLIEWLRERGALGLPEGRFVEPWRRRALLKHQTLIDAWKKIESRGEDGKWLRGVETEEEWANMLDRLAKWALNHTEAQGDVL